MRDVTEAQTSAVAGKENREINADIIRVCQRIPPLWDLPNYVAVNPFLGFAAQPLVTAAALISEGLGADVLPPTEYYRARWREGAFDLSDLTTAARRFEKDPLFLERVLNGELPMTARTSQTVLTYAERYDQQYRTGWNNFLIAGAARWCAVYSRQEGPLARDAGQEGSLYGSWREAAQADRSPEIAGLGGWRAWAGNLPTLAEEAISEMLSRLGVFPAERISYLYRLLGGVYGWASFFRRSPWDAGSTTPGLLRDLLALRICGDAAVPVLAKAHRRPDTANRPQVVEEESTRLVLQEALEDGFLRSLFAEIDAALPPPRPVRAAVQAVFCIDTRSEPLRRHLETASQDVETIGFAGFFGVSLNWQQEGVSSARCPVLLKPTALARSNSPALSGFGTVLRKALKYIQGTPASSFTFVELLGAAYGVGLAGDALVVLSPQSLPEGTTLFEFGGGLSGEDAQTNQIDLAAGILKNMGLRSRFSRLVLFCGHQGDSANNSHSASLDCGACGGHSGAINARVAAALLNAPAVRLGLKERGFTVPDDTHFLPGVHHTSTDDVILLDTDQVPQSHCADLIQLRRWLAEAAQRTRSERAAALGLRENSPGSLSRSLRRRADDWSEVRPEWGLARNAAFIAAPRHRTRGVDLGGRAFLHEYDWTADPDNSVLELILSAPMVVASWINLQYFASTVDNRTFGCGTKALHNRVEDLGVVLGNGGDLRTGLPVQSVHAPDGRWYHEPLRLQVIVEAPPERIDAALSVQTGVRDLVENGWVRLYSFAPDSSTLVQWRKRGATLLP